MNMSLTKDELTLLCRIHVLRARLSQRSLCKFSKPYHMFYGLICIEQKAALFSFFLGIFVPNLRTEPACMMVFSSSYSCFMFFLWWFENRNTKLETSKKSKVSLVKYLSMKFSWFAGKALVNS